MQKKKVTAVQALSAAAKKRGKSKYILKLYVAGITKKSAIAIRSITDICDEYLKGRYSLEIVDIYKNPTLAKGEQIIAVPTLIKELPHPLRKLIGDMADREKVLLGLDLKPLKKTAGKQPVKI